MCVFGGVFRFREREGAYTAENISRLTCIVTLSHRLLLMGTGRLLSCRMLDAPLNSVNFPLGFHISVSNVYNAIGLTVS